MADYLTSPFEYYQQDTDSVILAQNKHGQYPAYRCWRPQPGIPLAKSSRSYRPLTNVARVLHIQDFLEVFNSKSIIPLPIRDDSNSILPTGYQGSWFGVSNPSEESNWYGNVSCKVDFQDLLYEFRPRCYLIEIVQYRTVSAPRLMLTTQHIPEEIGLVKYNPDIYGGPWFRDQSGANYYLEAGRLHKDIESQHSYELEFFLVLSNEEYKKMYEMCEISPVNHEYANFAGKRRCKKFRSGLRNDQCPSPLNIQECKASLEAHGIFLGR